jgi:hypothetical protein
MTKESGDRSYPIWLLVNPKYPTVIHDIWAPILYEIQDRVYRKLHLRIETSNIFIKNAVSDIGLVSNAANSRAAEVAQEIVKLRENIREFQPKILITFGTILDEFVRRVFDLKPEKGPNYWSTTNLDDEFERSIATFDINQTNRIPLVRRLAKSTKFIEDQNYFSWEDTESYFREVGTKLADRIIENKDNLKIWVE